MQRLDQTFLNQLPDNESVEIYLKSLPTKTLRCFLPNTEDFFHEIAILEENYHTLLQFFREYIHKNQKKLDSQNEEIQNLVMEKENLLYSLNNNSSITQDFYEWNQKLHERAEILISRNQELETQFYENSFQNINNISPENKNEKSIHFLSNIEDTDEDFLRDFFQKENNANFLKKLGFFCTCRKKITKLEKEIEKTNKTNENLTIENARLSSRNAALETKVEKLHKELRKCQNDLKILKGKSYFYENFKFDFLISSKKQPHELDIQSATRLNQSQKFKRLQKKSKKHSMPIIPKENSYGSISLLSDIRKTMEIKVEDFKEIKDFSKEIEEFKCSTVVPYKSGQLSVVRQSSCGNIAMTSKKNKRFPVAKSKIIDFSILFAIYIIGFMKKTGISNRSLKNWVLLGPKIAMFLTILYWSQVFNLCFMFYERTKMVSSKYLTFKKSKKPDNY